MPGNAPPPGRPPPPARYWSPSTSARPAPAPPRSTSPGPAVARSAARSRPDPEGRLGRAGRDELAAGRPVGARRADPPSSGRAARCWPSGSPASVRRWCRSDAAASRCGPASSTATTAPPPRPPRCASGSATPDLHARTGHVPTAFHIAAKIGWIRAHEPATFGAARLFLQPSEYVALALTGEPVTDWTLAGATAMFDISQRIWAADLLAWLDLDPGPAPVPQPSWTIAGELRPALVRRLGLARPVPVIAGAADSLACALGAGVIAPGPVSEMAGSSTCLNSAVAEPRPTSMWLDLRHADAAGGYMTETGINTAGEASTGSPRSPTAAAAAGRGADYDRLTARRRRPAGPTACCSCRCSATASATTRICAAPRPACRCGMAGPPGPGRPWRGSRSACARWSRCSAGTGHPSASCGSPDRRRAWHVEPDQGRRARDAGAAGPR